MTRLRVARLASTPVKGTRIVERQTLRIDQHGSAGDRLFYVIDAAGRLVNGRRWGPIVSIASHYDPSTERLALELPGGRTIEDRVRVGTEQVSTRFFDHDVAGMVVEGPWSAELSGLAGRELLLVQVSRPSLGVDLHPVTLVSSASLDCLADATGLPSDSFWRRFRLNVEIAGAGAHEEDAWVGRRVMAGSALLEVIGLVPRCAVVQQDPGNGNKDGEVLKAILNHQVDVHGAAASPGGRREPEFGAYARVLRPGRIDVGSDLGLVDDVLEPDEDDQVALQP